MSKRKEKVVLKGQNSSWISVRTGVPQGSILEPLSFLIYINELADDFSSNVKHFGDEDVNKDVYFQ